MNIGRNTGGRACFGLILVLLVQCSGRSKREALETDDDLEAGRGTVDSTTAGVGAGGGVGSGGAAGIRSYEGGSSGSNDVVGGAAARDGRASAGAESVGGSAGLADNGGSAGRRGDTTAGTAGEPDVPINPCASGTGHRCGSTCTQCNTDDGSCYAGTCNFLGDCTVNDPQCGPNPKRSCGPTDAQGWPDAEGNPCETVLGWAWDGKCIAVVGCRCIGSECGSLLADNFTCFAVYQHDSGCGS